MHDRQNVSILPAITLTLALATGLGSFQAQASSFSPLEILNLQWFPEITTEGFNSSDLSEEQAWTCPYWRWENQPQILGGIFQATIATDCTVSGALVDRIPALRDDLVRQVLSFPKIHSGPTPHEGYGMPGVRYDASIHVEDGGNVLDIREFAHVYSDGSDKIVYETLSQEIQATGQAAYLRKLDIRTDITKEKDPGTYTITLYSTTHVQKPSGIPNFLFLGPAKDTVRKQFQSSIRPALDHFSDVARGK
jgi:hypothetical protein